MNNKFMKIISLLISGLFFFTLINFSFAACQMPDISEYNNCTAGCDSISNLFQKADCVNTCIGNWSKSQDKYYKCLEDEREQAEQARQKKLEEQKLLEQQRVLERQAEQERLQEEQQDREQEQNALSPEINAEKVEEQIVQQTRQIGSTVILTHGQVEFWRDGKVSSIASGLEVSAGDVIRTGKDGTVELFSEDGTVQLGEDTVVGFIGLEFEPPRIVFPDTPEGILDPNYKYQLDDVAFWSKTSADLADFIDKNRPNFLIPCLIKKDIYNCIWDSATFLYNGVAWFDKKIKEDFPKRVIVTPTTAITPNGTEFIVEVAPDGSTTITTLDGMVFVTDLISRKTAMVGVNHRITVPKTSTGLGERELQQSLTPTDPKSIDRWWIKDTDKPKSETFLTFSIILLITVVGITVFLIKKHIKSKTKV